MNKYIKILLLSAVSMLLAAQTLCAEDYEQYTAQAADPPQHVSAVPLPDKVKFGRTTVPLKRHDLRERFDREVLAFTFMHSTTFLLIKRANLYFPLIEPILREYNIPDDFKYLAVVESYLNPRAVSPARAAGIWQFVPETAKQYGLEVGAEVDERYDLVKATAAACRYLQESYDLYNDWLTAAASYNGGRSRITTQLAVQEAGSFFDLYLNEETSRYVFRILAVKEVISNPKKYGFHLQKEDFYHTVRTRDVIVNTPIEDWTAWAIANGTTFVQLKYYNLWIRDNKLVNKNFKSYTVKIPYKEDLDFDIRKVRIHNKAWVN